MKKTLIIASCAAFALIATGASAKPFGSINKTQAHQKQRIVSGIKNDSLTNKEAYKLTQQQVKIAKKEHNMREDGLTLNERAKLNLMQAKASKSIYNKKHN